MKKTSKSVVFQGVLYLEVDAGSPLPPTPYVIFSESIFDKMEPRLQLPLRVIHKATRDILLNKRGYNGIGLDALELTKVALDDSRSVVKARAEKIIKDRKDEIRKCVVENLSKMGKSSPNEVKLDLQEEMKSFKDLLVEIAYEAYGSFPKDVSIDDRSDLISESVEAYTEILHGGKVKKAPEQNPGRFGPSAKTITLKDAIRVPWNSKRKFPGYVLREFAGIQKKSKKSKEEAVGLEGVRDKYNVVKHKQVPLRLLNAPAGHRPGKELPPHPPTIIYSRLKATYKALPQEGMEEDDPYLGLSPTVFRTIERKQKKSTAKSLKKYLVDNDIKHEETLVPDVYDVVIIQYLVGPWKDPKHSGRPFKVTAYSHGGLVYVEYLTSQKEAEKKVLYWMKRIRSKKLLAPKSFNFNYNNVPFSFGQGKIKKILSVLEKKTSSGKTKGYRVHDDVDNIYRIYRLGKGEEHPRIESLRNVSPELEGLNKSIEEQELRIDRFSVSMEKSKGNDRLEKRKTFLKMTKTLQDTIRRRDELKEELKGESEDVKFMVKQKRPMWLKPLKAWIRLIKTVD